MNYEGLILEVEGHAPYLSGTAYKVLWRLVCLSIERRNAELHLSHKYLATKLDISRESVAQALRDLSHIVAIEPTHGSITTIVLPARWMSPQQDLFTRNEALTVRNLTSKPVITDSPTPPPNMPGNSTPKVARNPGNLRKTRQVSSQEFRQVGADLRVSCQESRHVEPDDQICNAHARASIESNRGFLPSSVVEYIDRAWDTVEISEDKEADAALLSEWLYDYKCALGPLRGDSGIVDNVMLARILAIAPIEQLYEELCRLRANGRSFDQGDAWFFVTLCNKVFQVDPKTVRGRMHRQTTRNPAYESKPSLFQDQLVQETAGKVRKIS